MTGMVIPFSSDFCKERKSLLPIQGKIIGSRGRGSALAIEVLHPVQRHFHLHRGGVQCQNIVGARFASRGGSGQHVAAHLVGALLQEVADDGLGSGRLAQQGCAQHRRVAAAAGVGSVAFELNGLVEVFARGSESACKSAATCFGGRGPVVALHFGHFPSAFDAVVGGFVVVFFACRKEDKREQGEHFECVFHLKRIKLMR